MVTAWTRSYCTGGFGLGLLAGRCLFTALKIAVRGREEKSPALATGSAEDESSKWRRYEVRSAARIIS